MTWNYRLMRFGERLSMHEVYYTSEGQPELYSLDACTIEFCDSVDEVRRTLAKMLEACDKPVLDKGNFE